MRIISGLILVLYCLSPVLCFAQDTDDFDSPDAVEQGDALRNNYDNYDSLPVDTRSYNQANVSELKADPELSYGYTRTAISLWDSFKAWLGRILRNLFRPEVEEGRWYDFFIFTAVTLIVVYVIMRLLKINHLKLFYGSQGKKVVNQLVIEENIHEMDFEVLLSEAVEKKEYRKAIRLTYLLSLKLLADKQYIHWEPGKTNHDYLNELTERQLKPDFRELNYYFEYAWYGNFAVTPALFSRVDAVFSNWRKKI